MVVGGHEWLQGCVHGWGYAWLWGGMCGCGGCMVAGGMCGCGGACVVVGGMHGWGACVVVGGMHGCRGVCMVVGGMHGCRGMHGGGGHVWWQVGGVRGIQRDTVNERAVRILLECILVLSLIMSIYHLMHSCAKCHKMSQSLTASTKFLDEISRSLFHNSPIRVSTSVELN